MASINQIGRARKQIVRGLVRELKAVDTQVEVTERFLRRILSRKRDVPSDSDLERFLDQARTLAGLLDSLSKAGERAVRAWGIVV